MDSSNQHAKLDKRAARKTNHTKQEGFYIQTPPIRTLLSLPFRRPPTIKAVTRMYYYDTAYMRAFPGTPNSIAPDKSSLVCINN